MVRTKYCSASLWRSSVTNVFRCDVYAARWVVVVVVERKGLVVDSGEKAGWWVRNNRWGIITFLMRPIFFCAHILMFSISKAIPVLTFLR